MGILINGINGSFSGKVGNLVGSSWMGKSYIRSRPNNSGQHTAPASAKLRHASEKQLAQQARFALAVRVLNPVKDMLFTFRKPHKAATGYNLAVKYLLEHAIAGDYPHYSINYSEVLYTRGAWGRAECVEVLAEGESLLVGWYAKVYRPRSYGDDQVGILIYEPQTNTYFKGPAGIFRSEGMAVIPVPEAYRGKTLHTYVYCVSHDGKYSDSVYAGPIKIH